MKTKAKPSLLGGIFTISLCVFILAIAGSLLTASPIFGYYVLRAGVVIIAFKIALATFAGLASITGLQRIYEWRTANVTATKKQQQADKESFDAMKQTVKDGAKEGMRANIFTRKAKVKNPASTATSPAPSTAAPTAAPDAPSTAAPTAAKPKPKKKRPSFQNLAELQKM